MSQAILEETGRAEQDIAPIPEIEAAIEADAKALGIEPVREQEQEQEQERQVEPGRDERGRFRSAEEAERAGQDAPGNEGKPEGSATAEANAELDRQKQQQDKDRAVPEAGAPANGRPQSAWARENERKAKTWEAINQTKAEIAREKEQLDLERKQFEAQQSTSQQARRDENGFTAEQYQRRAGQWAAQAQALTQQAMAAELRGDFDAAERLNQQAAQEANLAKAANGRAAALAGGGVRDVWQALGADLPEAMQADSDLNKALRGALKGNAELLGHPMGPYRAAVRVGRELLQKQGAELAKVKTEADKVPGLTKQVAELSRELQELRAKTSLPGGAANLSRGAGGERRFEDLTVEEMERELNAMGRT